MLCFTAHPDDIDFGAAGTIAAWTAAGVEVSYCIMTDGDAGGFDPAHRDEIVRLRAAEQQRAAALVGVTDIHYLHERDGYLEPTHEVMREVVRLIRAAPARRRARPCIRNATGTGSRRATRTTWPWGRP